jgi:diguanylate cyclase (GGDEF)-like protein
MVENVTDQQLLEQRVRHQSLHDLLTGLPNRLHFAIYLEALLERDRSTSVMLCKIDLDSFTIVTDGLGPSAGDFMLRSVAARLQELVAGERAFLARFGGDEFAAVPPVRVDLTTYLTQDPDLVAVVRDALAAAQLQPEDIQLGMPVSGYAPCSPGTARRWGT